MPKKSKKSKKKSKKRSFLKIFSVTVLILIGPTAGFFLYTNSKIEQRFSSTSSSFQPGIYADTTTLISPLKLSKDAVIRILERRHYTPAVNINREGEYRNEPDVITIRTRSWTDDEFEKRGGEIAHINFVDGTIINESSPGKNFITLEPELITTINDSDVRASRYKSLSDISRYLQNAVVAIEDERFFSHPGIDIIGTFRAAWANLISLRIVQGGSTITQQLAKNLFFSPTRSIWRKIGEAVAALNLEVRLTKEKILELYLNEVYLGQVGTMAIHGAGEAAQNFFRKDVKELTLAESALIAGIIQAPSYYAPRKHGHRATERMRVVLGKMRQLNMISDIELKEALAQQIYVYEPTSKTHPAPYFVTAIRNELTDSMNLEAALLSGASIYTGLNLDMQLCAEQAVDAGLNSLRTHFRRTSPKKPLEAGLVSIDAKTGKIRAWVGGHQYTENQFDHVVQAKRQVGSTIKPFVYLTALDPALNSYKVATPISLISDKPLAVDQPQQATWEPENFDKDYKGDVTFRYAFENSLNIPAVYIAQKVGIDAVQRTVSSFKVADNVLAVPSLALGAVDTTLLRLTTAYTALANGGVFAPSVLFTSIRDNSKSYLSSYRVEERLASEDAVYVVTDLMMGVIERGTGRSIRANGFTATSAGKTGTSNETRDAWFVGFTPDLVTGVWVGHDDNSETGLTGGIASAPIWSEYMKCIAPFHEQLDFIPPPGVIFVDVDYQTGSIALPGCKSDLVAKEVFLKGTEPITYCRGDDRHFEEPPDPNAPFIREKERPKRRSLFDILFG